MGQIQEVETRRRARRRTGQPLNGNGHMPPGAEAAIRELAQQIHLTRRENQIISLICRGLKNESMAGELGLTMPTVRFHIHNLHKKLGTADKSDVLLQVWKFARLEAAS